MGKFSESDLVVESACVVHVDYVVAVEKSSEGECDPKENALELVAEKALEISEITNQQWVESSELIDEETKPEEEDEEEVKTKLRKLEPSSFAFCFQVSSFILNITNLTVMKLNYMSIKLMGQGN